MDVCSLAVLIGDIVESTQTLGEIGVPSIERQPQP